MNNDVRRLTDGAMMCAIVGAVLLINRQLGGLFQDMFLFLFPIPMVFYSAKYGMRVYSFERSLTKTYTDAEKAAMEEEFMSNLQPADLTPDNPSK